MPCFNLPDISETFSVVLQSRKDTALEPKISGELRLQGWILECLTKLPLNTYMRGGQRLNPIMDANNGELGTLMTPGDKFACRA